MQCLVQHVQVESAEAENAEPDELSSNYTLSSGTLVDDFELELTIGHIVSGEFRALAVNRTVDIGEVIAFQLHSISTQYL